LRSDSLKEYTKLLEAILPKKGYKSRKCGFPCYLSQSMNQQEFEQIFDNLTDRRREVLEQVMLGQTDTAIALRHCPPLSQLGIIRVTARKYCQYSIYGMYGIRTI